MTESIRIISHHNLPELDMSLSFDRYTRKTYGSMTRFYITCHYLSFSLSFDIVPITKSKVIA
jgi:hypothetical protein